MSKKAKYTSRQIGIFSFVKVISFILPLFLYLLFTVVIFPSPNSAFLCIGIIGSFVIGLGFISIAGLLDNLYWGHFLTFAAIGFGAILILVSSIIMYSPSIYDLFDENFVSFYFFTWIALIISGIWYLFFRMGISRRLRDNRISKTQLDKLKKGYKNFWWYTSIHSVYGLGWLYWANKIYTLLAAITVSLHLVLGWYKPLCVTLAIAVCLLCFLNAIMWVSLKTYVSIPRKSRDELIVPGLALILGFVFPVLVGLSVIIYCFKNLIW